MDREKGNIKNNEHTFTTWVKKHKKGILVTGGAIVAIGAGYMVYKNWDSLTVRFKTIKPEPNVINNSSLSVKVEMPVEEVTPKIPSEVVSKNINNGESFCVREHRRTLSNGRNASAVKLAQAQEHGIILEEHETLVKSYSKNCA